MADLEIEVALVNQALRNHEKNMDRIEAAFKDGLKDALDKASKDTKDCEAKATKATQDLETKLSSKLMDMEEKQDEMGKKLDEISDTLSEFKTIVKAFKLLGSTVKIGIGVLVPVAGLVGWFISHAHIIP